MSEIKIIEGEIFKDDRGQISSLNGFHFDGVRRSYFICHPDPSVVRCWHGHRHERKWFYCIKGDFTLACVKIDNWEHPSSDLKAEIFRLSDRQSRIVCIPAGYANCLKTARRIRSWLFFRTRYCPRHCMTVGGMTKTYGLTGRSIKIKAEYEIFSFGMQRHGRPSDFAVSERTGA